MNTTILGIDLGKNWFFVVGIDAHGQETLRKKLNRTGIESFIANHPVTVVAMESCARSQYCGRNFQTYGHQIKLIPPQFAVPFRRAQKNDYNDALAIAEAASRSTIRTVPLRSQIQTDIQALHRARELVVHDQVQLICQIRGLLLENGVAIPQGHSALHKALPTCLDPETSSLSPLLIGLLSHLYERLQRLEQERSHFDREIAAIAKAQPACQRLMSIPGIGALIATALFAAVGNAVQFKSGRDLAAWIGLVPRQYSTGGKTRLLGLTKQGNTYLRKLLVHGARSIVRTAAKHQDPLRTFVVRLSQRAHANITVCAAANKISRIAWAVLRHEEDYRTSHVQATA